MRGDPAGTGLMPTGPRPAFARTDIPARESRRIAAKLMGEGRASG